MSSRARCESFILGACWKTGQMGCDGDGAAGIYARPGPTHAASWPCEDARRSIEATPGLRLDCAPCRWRGRMQAVLHQQCVVQGGDDGENKRRAQEDGSRNPDPAYGLDQQQQDEEDGGHLGEGVGFAEDAGAKIAQAG